MKAIEARIKYFEKYVSYEWKIKKLAEKMSIKLKNKTLSELISEISIVKSFPSTGLNSKILKKHKNARNWLSHSQAYTLASSVDINYFEKIDKMNMRLDDVIKKVYKKTAS